MSKRNNISYIKPQDPSFLRKLKEQIGYKEADTVETKRQKFDNYSDDDDSPPVDGGVKEDEKPQVVVLKAGDLTAEEADAEKQRIEKEELEKPADLSQRVIFKSKAKVVDETTVEVNEKKSKSKKDKKSSRKDLKSKLSFNDDEEEEDL